MSLFKPKKKSPQEAYGILAFIVIAPIVILAIINMTSGSGVSAPQEMTDSDYIYATKQGLEKRLKDRDSAEYRNVRVYHHPDKFAVCGEVNAKNSFGGFTGYQSFIGAGDLVVMPDDMAAGEFEKLECNCASERGCNMFGFGKKKIVSDEQKRRELLAQVDLTSTANVLLAVSRLTKALGIIIGVGAVLAAFGSSGHQETADVFMSCFFGALILLVAVFQAALINGFVFILVKLDEIAAKS